MGQINGNRTRKEDLLTGDVIEYHYDYENPSDFGPPNSRLMYYETYEAGNPEPVSTTYYYYNFDANVTRVLTEQAVPEPGEPRFSATWLTYATNGQAVAFVVGEEWTDGCGEDSDYVITFGREFRYDGPRQRYLNRELDPALLQLGTIWDLDGGDTHWSDYDGDAVYADYTVEDSPTPVTDIRSYEPGMGKTLDPLGTPETLYYHTDHLGTTRGMTDAATTWVDGSVYSAFGERLGGTNHRYGYVGKHGYQAHDEFPFLHVGARYYDPTLGRFLQRDPIGIFGGVNVYAYVNNMPTGWVDPTGKGWWSDLWYGRNRFHEFFAKHFWMHRYNPARRRLPKMGNAEACAWVAGYTAVGTAAIYYGGGAVLRSGWVRPYFRIEAHPIGGMRGALRTKSLWHVNLGKKHILLNPRYWFK